MSQHVSSLERGAVGHDSSTNLNLRTFGPWSVGDRQGCFNLRCPRAFGAKRRAEAIECSPRRDQIPASLHPSMCAITCPPWGMLCLGVWLFGTRRVLKTTTGVTPLPSLQHSQRGSSNLRPLPRNAARATRPYRRYVAPCGCRATRPSSCHHPSLRGHPGHPDSECTGDVCLMDPPHGS